MTGHKWSTIYFICVKNDGNDYKLGKMVGVIDGIAGLNRVLSVDMVETDNEPCHIIRFYTMKPMFRIIKKRIAALYPDLFKYGCKE